MTTLIARVLLTLAFVAIATAQTCPLCPNGKKPRNGNAIVFQGVPALVTCTELEQVGVTNSGGTCGDSVTHPFQVVCEIGRASCRERV